MLLPDEPPPSRLDSEELPDDPLRSCCIMALLRPDDDEEDA